MSKGYWIARVDVADPEHYGAYVAANAEPFRMHGARFLVRGGTFEAVEGHARSRNVVIEFPTYGQAVDCWHSREYQRAKALRDGHATAELIAIEGVDRAASATDGAKGYWIGRIDVTDPEAYKAYVAADAEAFAKHKANFLVHGGRFQALEGPSRARNIVLEFESQAQALACYHSAEYQRAKRLRDGHAVFELVIAEGYVGPQP